MLKRNESAETKLLEGLPSEQTINTLPIERFKIPLKDELRAFVHVRLLQTSQVPKNVFIPSNKGKLPAAIAGEDNLILVAFNTRCKIIVMPRPETDDDGNVVVDDINKEGSNDVDNDDVMMVEADDTMLVDDDVVPP